MPHVTLTGSGAEPRPAVTELTGVRPATAWSDLPTGDSTFDQVRRQLRVLQIHRATVGRGLAA